MYIKNQIEEDEMMDQMTLKIWTDTFTGSIILTGRFSGGL